MRVIIRLCLVFILFSNSSCKKVIELELRESDIKYVIEGIITNEPGSCKVLISQSKAFYEDNQFSTISGANVTIADNGQVFSLLETQPGTYSSNAIMGKPGHTYQLTVTINDKQYTASSTMPQPVLIDTLYLGPGPFNQFQFANIGYTDPAGGNNHYRFVQYVDGKKDPFIFLERDEFTDDQSIVIQLDTGIDKQDDPRNINSGDKVTIEMLGLDESIHNYWYSLRLDGGDGSGNSASPSNPATNLTGDALGYFSAHTITRKTVIAP